MINLVLLGPPGSGKGTQAEMMAKFFEIPAISTGDALRKEVQAQSEVGKKAKSFMDSGGLVPDEVVVDIVKNRINQKDCEKGFILDGFPRNLEQAKMLDEMLKSIAKDISLVLDFKVDDEVVVKRISGRFFCSKCKTIYNKYFKQPVKSGVCDVCGSSDFDSRSDDKEEIVRNRLKVYHDSCNGSSGGLVEFYQRKNLIFSLNAVKNSTPLFEEIVEKVRNMINIS